MKSVEYLRDKSDVIKKYPGIYRLWIEHDAYSEWKNTQTPSTIRTFQIRSYWGLRMLMLPLGSERRAPLLTSGRLALPLMSLNS